jgi:Flp pilus assembly protein TadD
MAIDPTSTHSHPPGSRSTDRERQKAKAVVVVAGVVAIAAFCCFAAWSNSSRFLPLTVSGEWIVYPTIVDPGIQKGTQRAVFSRSFQLSQRPGAAPLEICAFGQYSITLNSAPIPNRKTAGDTWRQTVTYDVASYLRPGLNDIRIDVRNNAGPPALSCCLSADEETIRSDSQWEVTLNGGASHPARPASTPMEPRAGNRIGAREQSLDGLRAYWPLLLMFAVGTATLIALSYYLPKLIGAEPDAVPKNSLPRRWPLRLAASRANLLLLPGLLASLVWLLLFLNNQRSLIFFFGYDAPAHIEYIRYIRERAALPLADEGWEMHHPPLYYIIAAALVKAFGVSLDSLGAIRVISGLSLVLGIAQVLLVFACLRVLFPHQPRRQGIGLMLATFLPVHLYLFQSPTNETLATTLCTAAFYLTLKIVRSPALATRQYVLLGLCLGAALLSKVTAMAVAAVILLVLAGRLFAQGHRHPWIWLRTMGVVLLVSMAVSGWHYVRVWRHFGGPFVGIYDAPSGLTWWQHPGYSTLPYFLRCGHALSDPFFSTFYGYADGLYSTLWGDGLWGGAVSHYRSPWNYQLMATGYLLAAVPSLAVAVGIVAATAALLREPRTELFLLIGLPVSLGAALLFQYLKFPYYSHVKAAFILAGAASLCSFAAWGFDILFRWRAARLILGAFLGTWAMTALASFWVPANSAAIHAWQGHMHFLKGDVQQATRCFGRTLQADPHNLAAGLGLGTIMFGVIKGGALEPRLARTMLETLDREVRMRLSDHPDNPELLRLAGLVSAEAGRTDEAIARFQRAVELGPDDADALYFLATCLQNQGRRADAIPIYRQAIGMAPANIDMHCALAELLAAEGSIGGAVEHYQLVLSLPIRDPRAARALVRLFRLW